MRHRSSFFLGAGILVFLICALLTTSPNGQLATRNPLDELKDQVAYVLVGAGFPITPEQDRELALPIEEQRQASEDLFGQIMDFRGGVPQGQELDRAVAGIQWIHDEFKKKLPNYLTDEQRANSIGVSPFFGKSFNGSAPREIEAGMRFQFSSVQFPS